jgi:tetratricopeptide (TPR) repeat protein
MGLTKHEGIINIASKRRSFASTAAFPWRQLLLLGGALLAMMAGVTLVIAPEGGWFALTLGVTLLGVCMALTAGVLLVIQRQRRARGLEHVGRPAYLLPGMIGLLILALLASLLPLPQGYDWANTLLFLVLLGGALWLAWQMMRTAAPTEYQRAQQAYQRGEFDVALGLLDEVERQQPEYYGSYYLKALIYRQRRQFSPAREATERLLALRPDLYYGYAEQGLLLLAEGHPQEARIPLQRATEVAPELAEAYFNLGMAYAEEADHAGTVAALSRALYIGLSDGVTQLMARHYLVVALRDSGQREAAHREWLRLRRRMGTLRRWRRELSEGSLPAVERHKEEKLIAEIERLIGEPLRN